MEVDTGWSDLVLVLESVHRVLTNMFYYYAMSEQVLCSLQCQTVRNNENQTIHRLHLRHTRIIICGPCSPSTRV